MNPNYQRRAKIAATLGPSTDAPGVLEAILDAGVDLVRFNLSHGLHSAHKARLDAVRAWTERTGRPVSTLIDLQGPKIRVGPLAEGTHRLEAGHRAVITPGFAPGTPGHFGVDYPDFAADVRVGQRVLITDGLMQLRIDRIDGKDVHCTVIDGGPLETRKGVNLPDTVVTAPALTPKDEQDLAFACEAGADYVAVSFVRRASGLAGVRRLLTRPIPLIAKVETPLAVEYFDEILDASDGIIVARGDLGVEIEPERVPILQKRMLMRASLKKIPAMVATQMLDSMIVNPRPTRAEVSDVANAIYDGADMLLLSGETAQGKHPIGAIQMMGRIIAVAEQSEIPRYRLRREMTPENLQTVPFSVADAAARVAREVSAKYIVVFTRNGSTAGLISKFHPPAPIVAYTASDAVWRRMPMLWGTMPRMIPEIETTDGMIEAMIADLRYSGMVSKGERVVILALTQGQRPGGDMNLLEVCTID